MDLYINLCLCDFDNGSLSPPPLKLTYPLPYPPTLAQHTTQKLVRKDSSDILNFSNPVKPFGIALKLDDSDY